jgi:hypothetical protein
MISLIVLLVGLDQRADGAEKNVCIKDLCNCLQSLTIVSAITSTSTSIISSSDCTGSAGRLLSTMISRIQLNADFV